MFAKSFFISAIVFAFSAQVHGHAGLSPALGVSGTFVRADVQRPKAGAECGNTNVAQNLDTSTAVQADANGQFPVTGTTFDTGSDGSLLFTAKVDPTGTGNNFVAATMVKNGSPAPPTLGSTSLVAQLPPGTKCSGGTAGDLCLASFTSGSGFGNCVVVKQAAGGATAAAPAAAAGNDAADAGAVGATTGAVAGAAVKGGAGGAAAGAKGAATGAKGAKKAAKKGGKKAAKKPAGSRELEEDGAAQDAAGADPAAAIDAATATDSVAAADPATAAAAADPAAAAKGTKKAKKGKKGGKKDHKKKKGGKKDAKKAAAAGTRAPRALLAELESRGEDCVDAINTVKRSILGWVWA